MLCFGKLEAVILMVVCVFAYYGIGKFMELFKPPCARHGHPHTKRRFSGAWMYPCCECGESEGAGWIGNEYDHVRKEQKEAS